jgi:hypothetical protein
MPAQVSGRCAGYAASQITGKFSTPRNAQPPIRTGSASSSRKPFNRVKMPGSAAAASRIYRQCSGILGRPVKPGDDQCE